MKRGSSPEQFQNPDGACNTARASRQGSMSTKHSVGNELSDTTEELTHSLGDQLNSATIGTDADGYDHHYWRNADAVVVYDESGVDHVEYLNGRLLADWAAYVDDERGWAHEGQFGAICIRADRRRKAGEN